MSLPIKVMDHKTILNTVCSVGTVTSHYFRLAAQTKDPVERMKFVVTGAIAYHEVTHHWNKPLNPIIGETYQASGTDGSRFYLEQVSHHPPISYITHVGPFNQFRFHGYASIAVHAHLNSISMEVKGHKTLEFPDGTKIVYNNASDAFKNTIFGTFNHQLLGSIEWKDEANKVAGFVKFAYDKKKPTDYFMGTIT